MLSLKNTRSLVKIREKNQSAFIFAWAAWAVSFPAKPSRE